RRQKRLAKVELRNDARCVDGLLGGVLRPRLKARPAIVLITLAAKPAGERRTGKPSAPFDRAGAGDGRMAYRASPRPYSGPECSAGAVRGGPEHDPDTRAGLSRSAAPRRDSATGCAARSGPHGSPCP